MKTLYKFVINKEAEVETQVETKNENGEVVITKKKEKQLIPHNFFVAKPTRSLSDQAGLYNSVMVSEGLKKGLLSIYSLDKKYREEGVFTDEDNKQYRDLYAELIKSLEELQVISKVLESDRTDEQKKKWEELTKQIESIRLKLKDYENIKNGLYTHSAEFRARNMTITWWVLNLSYKEEGGKELPFFTGNTTEEKLKCYDELMEKEDGFIKDVIERFMYVVSFWVVNGSDKPEDFVRLEKYIEDEKKELITS